MFAFTRRQTISAGLALAIAASTPAFAQVSEIRVDYATYNPLSLVIREQKVLEKEFEKDKINVRWVLSAGSNKALEFLNAGSLDIGSTAGAAALVGKINGNPIKTIGIFSRHEWTALVTGKDSKIANVADLKGRRIAVTRGTDPHIFLVRALDKAGLTEKDVRLVLLQHADGKTALVRGDVDAWAGLDPIMAQAEIEDGAKLLYRRAEDNTWGVLNTREDFANKNPEIVRRVLRVYEEARIWARANPDALKRALIAETKLPDPVITRQLERTDLTHAGITSATRETIIEAGLALQKAGVLKPETDIKATVESLIDTRFAVAAK